MAPLPANIAVADVFTAPSFYVKNTRSDHTDVPTFVVQPLVNSSMFQVTAPKTLRNASSTGIANVTQAASASVPVDGRVTGASGVAEKSEPIQASTASDRDTASDNLKLNGPGIAAAKQDVDSTAAMTRGNWEYCRDKLGLNETTPEFVVGMTRRYPSPAVVTVLVCR